MAPERPTPGDQPGPIVSSDQTHPAQRLSHEGNPLDSTPSSSSASQDLAAQNKDLIKAEILPNTQFDFGSGSPDKLAQVARAEAAPRSDSGVVPTGGEGDSGALDKKREETKPNAAQASPDGRRPDETAGTVAPDQPTPQLPVDAASTGAPDRTTAQQPVEAGSAEPKPGADKVPANDILFKGVQNPDEFQQQMTETAKRLVAAAGNPEEAARIFDEAAAKFSLENPTAAGSAFSRTLRSALDETPGNPGLRVDSDGSEGVRDGKNKALLMLDNGVDVRQIAQAEHQFSNGATAEERDGIAQHLSKVFPQEAAELTGPNAMRRIVDSANELIIAQSLGQDVKPIFEQAAADFRENNPNAAGSAFARLLNNALNANPQPTSLFAGFAGSDGIRAGHGDAMLLDGVLPPGKRSVAQVHLEFTKP